MGLGTVHCQPSDRQRLDELIEENERYREALKKIAFSSMTKTEAQLCKIASEALFKTEGDQNGENTFDTKHDSNEIHRL